MKTSSGNRGSEPGVGMTVLGAGLTVGALSLASRLLGFARTILTAAILGAGPVADAFFIAYRIPMALRRVLSEGALRAGFVPMFSRRLATDGRAGARGFAEEVLAVILVSFGVLVALLELAMPWLVGLLAPGFDGDPARYGPAVTFGRIMAPYLVLVSVAALLGAMLNGLGRFASAAALPLLLNLCLIGGLLALGPMLSTPAHGLAWAVPVAGAAQLVWLVAACRRRGAGLVLRRPRLTPALGRLARLTTPAVLGAAALQMQFLAALALASLLEPGAVSWLSYADRVARLVAGVVGLAAGTALLPALSRHLVSGEAVAAARSLNRTLEGALLLTLPAAAALMTIPGPVVAVLFERGGFSAADGAATAAALAAFAAGAPALVLVRVFGTQFFAAGDTTTPMWAGLTALGASFGLALLLMGRFGHIGIAAGLAAAWWLHAGVLGVVLLRRGVLSIDARLRRAAPRIVAASVGMAAALWALPELRATAGAGGWAGAGALAGLVLLGLAVYPALAALLGLLRPEEWRRALRGGTQ